MSKKDVDEITGGAAERFTNEAQHQRQDVLQEQLSLARKTTKALQEARKVAPRKLRERFTI